MRRKNAGYVQFPSLAEDSIFRVQVTVNAKIQTLPTLPTLPNELWLYIAEFIPPLHRTKLLGINRLLFEVVMSELYGRVDFTSSDHHTLFDQLQALQNPTLSRHVRILSLQPAYTRDAMVMKAPKADLKTRLYRYLFRSRGYLGGVLNHTQPVIVPNSRFVTPKQREEMFINTVRCFTNLEEFQVIWTHDVAARHAWTFSCFPQIWEAFGQNLLKLSIDIDVFKMGDVVKDCGTLPRLEELLLTLRFYDPRGQLDKILVQSFFNKFSPTLQHLSITSHDHYEFSKAFQLLGSLSFPRLSKLSLSIPLDIFHFRDTSGLRRFLRTHLNIEHFCMRYKPCCKRSAYDKFQNDNIQRALNSDSPLPAMHTLELGLRLAIFNPLFKEITNLGNNLTTLILQDSIMDFNEIKTALSFFSSQLLKKLLFAARELSHNLIDYLARAFPALDSLSLFADLVVATDPISRLTHRNACLDHREDIDWAGLKNAWNNCDNRNTVLWTLSDISIIRYRHSLKEYVYDWECMLAIANVVPSLTSFAGRGHMKPAEDCMSYWPTKVKTPLDLTALDQWRTPHRAH